MNKPTWSAEEFKRQFSLEESLNRLILLMTLTLTLMTAAVVLYENAPEGTDLSGFNSAAIVLIYTVFAHAAQTLTRPIYKAFRNLPPLADGLFVAVYSSIGVLWVFLNFPTLGVGASLLGFVAFVLAVPDPYASLVAEAADRAGLVEVSAA